VRETSELQSLNQKSLLFIWTTVILPRTCLQFALAHFSFVCHYAGAMSLFSSRPTVRASGKLPKPTRSSASASYPELESGWQAPSFHGAKDPEEDAVVPASKRGAHTPKVEPGSASASGAAEGNPVLEKRAQYETFDFDEPTNVGWTLIFDTGAMPATRDIRVSLGSIVADALPGLSVDLVRFIIAFCMALPYTWLALNCLWCVFALVSGEFLFECSTAASEVKLEADAVTPAKAVDEADDDDQLNKRNHKRIFPLHLFSADVPPSESEQSHIICSLLLLFACNIWQWAQAPR
jgi:hypothetical protein